MKLTEKNKSYIDSLDYEALLKGWRFSPIGDPMFQDETGDYWNKRLSELKDENHSAISKHIGW